MGNILTMIFKEVYPHTGNDPWRKLGTTVARNSTIEHSGAIFYADYSDAFSFFNSSWLSTKSPAHFFSVVQLARLVAPGCSIVLMLGTVIPISRQETLCAALESNGSLLLWE